MAVPYLDSDPRDSKSRREDSKLNQFNTMVREEDYVLFFCDEKTVNSLSIGKL